jgi:precorrin-8X/cobalt-precorrin-8 methylmutase
VTKPQPGSKAKGPKSETVNLETVTPETIEPETVASRAGTVAAANGLLNHPILEQSFTVIDREIGAHAFTAQEYAIVRRVIHSTADFDFQALIRFSPGAIKEALSALRQSVPIVVDVNMVKHGIATLVQKTFGNPIIVAVEQAKTAAPGKTRTETGMLQCWQHYPQAIYVVGNAPTALLALCEEWRSSERCPPMVIAAPVGFIAVVESKAAVAALGVPQIRIEGRKGGSPVAAAIVNALLVLAWERENGEIQSRDN